MKIIIIKYNKFKIIFITLFVMSACVSKNIKILSSDTLLIPLNSSIDSLAFPKTLKQEQISEDIDFLIYTLSNAYGGKNFISSNVFSQAIQLLNSAKNSLTLADFHNQIDNALFLIPDNHLKAYYQGKTGDRRRSYDEKTKGQVGINNISSLKKIWEVRTDYINRQKILYIALMKFPDRESQEWKGFITAVSSKMNLVSKIVIDLRGNIGGDDSMGMELAGLMYSRSFENPIKRQYRNQSADAIALLRNRIEIEIMNLNYDHNEIPNYLINQLTALKVEYDKVVTGNLPREYIRTDKRYNYQGTHRPRDKHIYILMDRSCGSSCEFTIASFDWLKTVQKIGENTNGSFHFSNAGIAVLPNSKIKIMIPSQFNEYYDHRFFERIGINPDIRVSPGQDAYNFLKNNVLKNSD